MPRRILIIFNPMAGPARRCAARLRAVVAELERRGCAAEVRCTRAPGDAERLAAEADPGFDLIVAAGGDGTVNEVVNGLFGRSQQFAVLPLGTGNVLANEIGMPRDPQRLAEVIANGQAKPVWPGRAGRRLFVAMAGIGFDAEVLAALDPNLKRWFGKLAFAWAILLSLWRYRRRQFVVDPGAHRVASVIVTKGRLYAGRFVIAPDADIADPLFHVLLFKRDGRLAILRYLAALTVGILHRLPEVSTVTARRVVIAAAASEEDGTALGETDGEVGARLPLVIEIADSPMLLVQPSLARRR